MKSNKISPQELARCREDTSGSSCVVHLNNAGTSLPPDSVLDTVISYLREEATYGGYETEYKHLEALNNVYRLIAQLINASEDEIALCENAGTAWGIAFKGLDLQPGDEVITSAFEYTSSVISLIDAQKAGVKVTVINHEANGRFPLDQLESAITDRTKLIAVAHVASSGGGMLPVEAIGRIAGQHKILYMVDACQSVGQYPVDVKAIGCDILSATGRKYLRAPRGTAFLFVRKEIQNQVKPLFADDRGAAQITVNSYTVRQDAKRYELYEKNRALTLGLGAAVTYALEVGINRIWARVQELAAYLRSELIKIKDITVHDLGRLLSGTVTFTAAHFDTRLLQQRLVNEGLNVSYSSATDTPYYMNNQGLSGLVRASVHFYNTFDEIDLLCNAIKLILDPQL